MILGELKRVRKQRGLSIQHLASQLAVSEPTVSRWLRGQALTIDVLEQICGCLGTDLRSLIDQASDTETDRLSLRQEQKLAADRRLSLMFFLVLNGAQRDLLEGEFKFAPDICDDLIDRLIRLGLVARSSSGRLRPLVSRSVRWQHRGPLAEVFERHDPDYDVQLRFRQRRNTLCLSIRVA